MRKLMCVLLAISLVAMASIAMAGDIILKTTIQSAVERTGNDGAPYIRFIVNENRVKTVNGVEYPYTVGVAVMCFGDLIDQGRKLAQGDELNGIVQEREWQGRKSYVLLSFLK